MRALVIEHDPLSRPERLGAHLERRGITLEPRIVVSDISQPEVTATFPNGGDFDMVVLMGAPWSVYDPRVQGWVVPEIEFIRHQFQREIPVLGVCFGAQLVATALGGTVSRSDRPEYGWGFIDSKSPAIATGPWFQYHQDEFTLPEGATELAHNDSGLQAFAFGRNLSVQFHPEVTPSLISSWCSVGGDQKLIAAGIDPDELIEETGRRAEESQPALERMLDWWLNDMNC